MGTVSASHMKKTRGKKNGKGHGKNHECFQTARGKYHFQVEMWPLSNTISASNQMNFFPIEVVASKKGSERLHTWMNIHRMRAPHFVQKSYQVEERQDCEQTLNWQRQKVTKNWQTRKKTDRIAQKKTVSMTELIKAETDKHERITTGPLNLG